VTPQATPVERIEQSLYHVPAAGKVTLLADILDNPELARVIVFARTKHRADRVTEQLAKRGHAAEAIHGNKSQNARQRALKRFRAGDARVLVATDIAARGIDIDGITHVVNYELPNEPESYVHRIGRTARAGAHGAAVSFCDPTERGYLRDIEKLIQRRLTVIGEEPPMPETIPGRPTAKPPRRKAGAKPGVKTGAKTGAKRSSRRPGRNARKRARAEAASA